MKQKNRKAVQVNEVTVFRNGFYFPCVRNASKRWSVSIKHIVTGVVRN